MLYLSCVAIALSLGSNIGKLIAHAIEMLTVIIRSTNRSPSIISCNLAVIRTQVYLLSEINS